ncbi:MAG TPA: hypothetical protein VER03_03375 [Bryobacteraceae bacterium]|nr:hypothetical protein [Bryobacteraceae bacterium]
MRALPWVLFIAAIFPAFSQQCPTGFDAPKDFGIGNTVTDVQTADLDIDGRADVVSLTAAGVGDSDPCA